MFKKTTSLSFEDSAQVLLSSSHFNWVIGNISCIRSEFYKNVISFVCHAYVSTSLYLAPMGPSQWLVQTASQLAQLVEHRTVVREVVS